MKLQILIPHYHEPAEVLKPLLDSIAIQQSVQFDEIGVIICHDGDEPKDRNDLYFDNRKLKEIESPSFYFGSDLPYHEKYGIRTDYLFNIEQIHIPHGGVSACRNACFDHATADYVMFCDIDDMFVNACGLYIVFREFEQGFDTLISCFMEETRHPQTKEVIYTNHEMDSTFVHGKVHKREYLLKNNIRWNDNLTIHEDSFFNILCQNLTTNVKYCQVPFYLWKWRDESVCRHDPKYILKTYRNMLDSNDALIDEFLSRGRQDKAMFYTAFMVFDAYYTMNKPDWINQENREYRDNTEMRFSEWYEKHKDLWDAVPIMDKMQISNQVRARSINEGMQMEAVTVKGWLKHVEELRNG